MFCSIIEMARNPFDQKFKFHCSLELLKKEVSPFHLGKDMYMYSVGEQECAINFAQSLTLGAHAQRGLWYLFVCQSVCLSVCLSTFVPELQATRKFMRDINNNKGLKIMWRILLKALRSRVTV